MSEAAVDSNTQVSHTDERGRTLSGMGATVERLEETMERHAPEPPAGTETKAMPAATESEGGQAPAPDVKATRGRQRFADLTKERDDAKTRAEAAEARAVAAEARAGASPAAKEPDPVKTAEPSKPAAAPAEKFTFPKWETFSEANPTVSYDEWELERFMAYDAWKDARLNLDDRISQGISAREAARQTDEIVHATRAKGREAYADFDAVMKSGPGAKVNLGATEEQAFRRVAMIYQHPQSEHLQYAILKDGALAQKLAAMDDISFGVALAGLVPAPAASRREHAPPPAPFTPVNGNGVTTATPSSALASKGFDFDKSGYREKRAAERKASRR